MVELMCGALRVITGSRNVGWSMTQVFEALYFTSDKMVVVRLSIGAQMGYGVIASIKAWKEARKQKDIIGNFSIEELLARDTDNFVITYDHLEKIELKKNGKGALIHLKANDKKYKWTVNGLSGSEDVNNQEILEFLKPLFKEKFSVSSIFDF
jgi:hypothetical protein